MSASTSVASGCNPGLCFDLAGYESPKRIVVVEDLPVTVGGKVLKYKLRQMLGQEAL